MYRFQLLPSNIINTTLSKALQYNVLSFIGATKVLSDITGSMKSPIMQPLSHSDLLDKRADFAETKQFLEVFLVRQL